MKNQSNELQDLENWSKGALESAPFGVMVHDEKGKILIFNAQLEKISGYRKSEIPDIQTWIDKLYPDHEYKQIVIEERKSKIPKNRLRIREAIITCKNGDKRICEFASIRSPTGIRTVFIKDTNVLREAQNSLRESEERFRFLSQAAVEGILIHKDGVLLFANDQLYEMFGYDPQELIGKKTIPIGIAPESLPFVEEQVRSGKSTPYEAMGRKKDGTIFPILVHARSMEYQDNEVRVAAIRDLSYIRQAESNLRKSEERFRVMAENVREVFWLFDWKNQKVEYISPAYEQIWGRSIEDLYENYAEWAASIYPDDLAYAQESFERIVQTGGGETRQYRIVRPDGNVRWVSDRGFAVKNKKGDVVRIVGIAEDISDRKRTEDALRKSENRYRKVVESMSEGLGIADQEYRFTYVNDKLCEMLGYARDEIIGCPLIEFVHDDFKELMKDQMVRRSRGEETRFELAWKTKGGDTIHTLASPRVLHDKKGHFAGSMGVLTDITNRIKAEKALQEKDAKLEQQAKNLTEMNTALKVVLEQREKEKSEMKETLLANVKKLVFPYIEKLENSGLDDDAQTFVNIIKSNISDLISPLASHLSSKYFALTPSEIQIADLIKQGKTSKEIASMMNVSTKAVSFHRGNLRRKLGLVNKKMNLRTYLHSFPQ